MKNKIATRSIQSIARPPLTVTTYHPPPPNCPRRAATSAKLPRGARYIIHTTIFMRASFMPSKKAMTCVPFSPTVVSAAENTIANSMSGNMFIFTAEAKRLGETIASRMSVRPVSCLPCTRSGTTPPCSASPTQGWIRLTRRNPSKTAMPVVNKKYKTVMPPRRPSLRTSPSEATPLIIAATMSGTMIILSALRNSVPIQAMPCMAGPKNQPQSAPPITPPIMRINKTTACLCGMVVLHPNRGGDVMSPSAATWSGDAHAHGVVAAVDVEDLAADTRGEIGTEEGTRIADLFDGDVALERRLLRDVFEHFAEVADARGGEGLDRTRRDRVDAYALRSEALRHVAHVRLEARLGEAHHVVVGHDTLGAEIAQSEQCTAAPRHHLAAGLRECGEAIGADLMRGEKTLAGRAVDIIALQLLARRIGRGMGDDVDGVPARAEFGEYVLDLAIVGEIARQHDLRAAFRRGSFHAGLQFFVLIGEGEFRAFAVHGLGDAPGDGAAARDADDQCAFALEKSHNIFLRF